MSRVRNCTKDISKALKIILLISIVALTGLYVTFKPAYRVVVNGETIGFVASKEIVEEKINNYINDTNENIASRNLSSIPEYKFEFVNRNIETNEEKVLENIQDTASTTYRAFAVNFNGEQKAVIASQDKANSIINELKADINDEIELDFDIVEIYSDTLNVSSEEDAKESLNEIKVEKIAEYEQKKAEEEKAAKAKAEAERKAKESASITPNTWRLEIPKLGVSGNILEGTSPDVLEHHIGHFSETVADNGNVGLAAHNAGHSANYFSRINSLVAGDTLYYIHGGVKKTYSVVSKDIISVYDWSKLGATGDERLTLITCVSGDTEIRLCVQAVRVD